MMRAAALTIAVLAAACVASEPGADASESGDVSTTATSSTATTSSSGSSTDDPDSGSTGAPGCAHGDPAMFTDVDGCAMVLGESFCSEGQKHVDQGTVIEWMHDPPHSGPHYPTWETWDEHDEVVPRGNWVHNLEHGGIVLSYRCDGDCEPELDVLRAAMDQRPELRILITEDPFLPGTERFAALAWTWVLRFDPPVLDELLCFADQHENHAPEDIP